MSTANTLKPVSIALGTVLSLSLTAIPASQAADNPFSMEPLSTGYMLLAENKDGEGKCGEGKCGGKDKHGMSKMDADGDGKVSKDEFMKGHEAKFDQLDKNGDGVIDASERGAQHKGKGKCKHGKGSKDKSGADT
jgi:uncharacterized low-complexity protein